MDHSRRNDGYHGHCRIHTGADRHQLRYLFTGYEQAGLKGAAVATLGMVLPPFLIIYLISIFLDGFLTMPLIAAALQGIKIAVGLGSLQNVVPNGKALLITVVLAGVMLGYKHFQKKKLSTIALIMLSAVVGIAASVCP